MSVRRQEGLDHDHRAIVVGMARPVHVLRRRSDVTDIINLSINAAVDAPERARAPQA